MIKQLRDQTDNSKKLNSFIESLAKFLDNRNWSEIGFYIFAGFLSGLVVGSLIAICICWIQTKSMARERVDPQIPMAIIDTPQDPGSSVTLRADSVVM